MNPDRLKQFLIFAGVTGLAWLVADIATVAVAAQNVLPPRTTIRSDPATPNSAEMLSADDYVKAMQSVFMPAVVPTISVTGAPGVPGGGPAPEGIADTPWDQWIGSDPQHSMTLLGTMVGSGFAVAVISVGSDQYAVGQGQQVGSWTIDSVSDTTVTFRKGQETKALVLPMMATAATANPPAAPQASNFQPPGPGGRQKIPVTMNGSTRIIAKSDVASILQDPSKIMSTARLQPVAKDGHPYGVKMSYLQADGLFGALGLQQDDVMLSINGREMRTPEEAFMAYQTLQNETTLVIKIERGGATQDLQVELR